MPRATAAAIGEAIGRLKVPTIKVQQLRNNRLWLVEGEDPFFEVWIMANGESLACRVSVHCSPLWAAHVTAKLATVCDKVVIIDEMFVQDERGRVLYGDDADTFWKAYQKSIPLLSARFSSAS